MGGSGLSDKRGRRPMRGMFFEARAKERTASTSVETGTRHPLTPDSWVR